MDKNELNGIEKRKSIESFEHWRRKFFAGKVLSPRDKNNLTSSKVNLKFIQI